MGVASGRELLTRARRIPQLDGASRIQRQRWRRPLDEEDWIALNRMPVLFVLGSSGPSSGQTVTGDPTVTGCAARRRGKSGNPWAVTPRGGLGEPLTSAPRRGGGEKRRGRSLARKGRALIRI